MKWGLWDSTPFAPYGAVTCDGAQEAIAPPKARPRIGREERTRRWPIIRPTTARPADSWCSCYRHAQVHQGPPPPLGRLFSQPCMVRHRDETLIEHRVLPSPELLSGCSDVVTTRDRQRQECFCYNSP